jgi:hypothetical protein
MKHVVPAVAVILSALQGPAAQSAITGRVVADATGESIPNARVALNLPASSDRVVVSDREGWFSLPVPDGRHNIVATKTRFARGQVTTAAYRIGGLSAGTFRVAVMTVGPRFFQTLSFREAATIFSMDGTHWYSRSRYVRRERTGADGNFAVSGLPEGQYYAVPVRNVPADGDEAWQDPAFLESLIPGATIVVIGDTASANLRLSDR